MIPSTLLLLLGLLLVALATWLAVAALIVIGLEPRPVEDWLTPDPQPRARHRAAARLLSADQAEGGRYGCSGA